MFHATPTNLIFMFQVFGFGGELGFVFKITMVVVALLLWLNSTTAKSFTTVVAEAAMARVRVEVVAEAVVIMVKVRSVEAARRLWLGLEVVMQEDDVLLINRDEDKGCLFLDPKACKMKFTTGIPTRMLEPGEQVLETWIQEEKKD
ncbi:hypothetical protein Tco_1245021 [Tanacetum coccineum]